jgi:hypothetical protein
MGTLGTTDGKEPMLGKNCRTDVFVVQVASARLLAREQVTKASDC